MEHRINKAQKCQLCSNKFFHHKDASLCDQCERKQQEQRRR